MFYFETVTTGTFFSCCVQHLKMQKHWNSRAVRHLSERSTLTQVITSCRLSSPLSWTLSSVLTSQVSPPPPHTSPACLSTFCPCVNISHCCCRWCVMRGTERSLCVRSVGAAVCGSLACGVSWQACGRWRQPAACLSVCLSVQLHLTGADIAIPSHTRVETCAHTPHTHCTTTHSAQKSN